MCEIDRNRVTKRKRNRGRECECVCVFVGYVSVRMKSMTQRYATRNEEGKEIVEDKTINLPISKFCQK